MLGDVCIAKVVIDGGNKRSGELLYQWYFIRNINYIFNKNELLKEQCIKHNFRLINISRGENRDKVLFDLVERIK